MAESTSCPSCGAARVPGSAFCSRCGTKYADHVTQPAPSRPADSSTGADGAAVGQRLRGLWLPLALVAVMGWVDYLQHRSIGFVVIVGGAAVLVMAFWPKIVQTLGLRPVLDRIPAKVRPVLLALPALLWFAIRADGTSGAGGLVVFVGLGLVAAISFFGPAVDQRLGGFYAARDRILPRGARLGLAIAAPILVAFVVAHGSLRGLPVLFQGTTSSSTSAADRPWVFALTALISGVLALLLLRERGAG